MRASLRSLFFVLGCETAAPADAPRTDAPVLPGTDAPVSPGTDAPSPVLDAPVSPTGSAGCGMASPATGELTLEAGGDEMTYIVSIPVGYDSSHPYPLGFGLHGFGRTHANCQERLEHGAAIVAGCLIGSIAHSQPAYRRAGSACRSAECGQCLLELRTGLRKHAHVVGGFPDRELVALQHALVLVGRLLDQRNPELLRTRCGGDLTRQDLQLREGGSQRFLRVWISS